MKPEHLRGGFKSAGLGPFNSEAVSRDRLSPSLVAGSGSSEPSPTPPTTSTQQQAIQVSATGTSRIGPLESPVRVELRAYFVNALKPADKKTAQRRRRVKLSDLGEVLTNDEVLERLEQAEAEKQKKTEEGSREEENEKPVRVLVQSLKILKMCTAANVGSCTWTVRLGTGSDVMYVTHGGIIGVQAWMGC